MAGDQGIYRGMSRAELDRAYSPSSMVDDVPAALREWTLRSAAARARLGAPRTLRYGPAMPERLDFFPAAGDGDPTPVMVFIHGGYWIEGSREDSAFLASDFVPRGVAFVALGYPLGPAAGLAEIADACERAFGFLLDRATDLGIDPGRVHLSGLSAGAHLAAMIATGPLSGRVASVTAVSGIFDLEPIALSYVGEPLRLDAPTARRNSPMHRLRPGLPPLAVAHGTRETAEFVRQSAEFAQAWSEAGNAAELVTVEGAHHFDVVLKCGDAVSSLGRAVTRLLVHSSPQD